MILVTQTLHDA